MPQTGTTDQTYDVISVIYHALNGAETYEQYVRDGESEGDEELTDFFRVFHAKLCGIAEEGKSLLSARLN